MAKTTSLYLPKGVNTGKVQIVNADTTTLKTLFTAGADDSNLKAIIATSDDTSTVNLRVLLTSGGTDYQLGTVRIVTLSGTDGAANNIDVLNSTAFAGLPLDANGKRYIPLKNGDVIKVAALATVTSGKTVNVTAFGEDF